MKNNFKFAAAGLILLSIITFTSCFNPIFYEIRKDVEPEPATVSGNIPNITRFTENGVEYLFLAADGGIRYKMASNTLHGTWAIYPTPFALLSYNFDTSSFTGQQVISVFASSNTLYLLSAEYSSTGSEGTTIPSKINLWGKSSLSLTEGWTLINTSAAINYFPIIKNLTNDYYDSYFNIFQTNSPMAAHRHVYICSYIPALATYKYYELSGTSEPVEITIPKIEDVPVSRVYSAAYINGSVKFFNSRAVTTNETYTAEATKVYYAIGQSIFYSDGTVFNTTSGLLAGKEVSCLATCSDALLIGCGSTLTDYVKGGGIEKAALSEDGVPTTLVPFTTNAAFQITETYPVLSLLNATPSYTELSSTLYASVTFYNSNGVYNNIGLWSYIPSRGNWNRE